MTKRRRVSLRDYVTYANHEWIVVGKSDKKVKLVRRQVCTGSAITVPKKDVGFADQTWRCRMQNGDALKVFIMGSWAPASVQSSNGKTVDVQPSFCNHIITLPVHSSRIVQDTHNFPLWEPHTSSLVLVGGKPRLSRGPGLVYPWMYTTYVPITPPTATHVIDYTFNCFRTESHPLSMYHCLSTEEIVYDLFRSTSQIPRTLELLVGQYVESRFPTFPVHSNASVEMYVNRALEQNDTRRVQELLSVGQYSDVFEMAECLMQLQWNNPVFDLAFAFENKKLRVTVTWTGTRASNAALRTVYQELSLPIAYSPHQYIGLTVPIDIAHMLSRMLGMEEEPLQNLHTRVMGNSTLALHSGIRVAERNKFGGVVCVYGVRLQLLVYELMRRKPMKTVIIVDAASMPCWKTYNCFYGRRRDDGNLVVTTKNTFIRQIRHFDGFERIVCNSVPGYLTTFHRALNAAVATTRWAICGPDRVAKAWNVHNMPRDERGEIRLTREMQVQRGVVFPTVNIRFHACKTPDATNVLENTQFFSPKKRLDTVCKFLMHPSLVAEHYGGEKLDMYEGTVKTIAEKLNVKQDLIEEHLKDKCAVCLGEFDNPTVTSCGHVYCADCTKELQTRGINCPMCRSNVEGYMRVSDKDTEGKVVMHNGDCYRITITPKWGAKMNYLRNHPEATIISRFPAVLRKLRKELPNKDMYTLNAHTAGRRPASTSIIIIEPCERIPIFEKPFGRDIHLTILSYPVDL
jgi:hypothetical protein